MKKLLYLIPLILLTSCTNFMGIAVIISFKDIMAYFVLSLIVSAIISFVRDGDKIKTFWIWFIIDLILTPFSGIIYLIYHFTKKK